MKFCSLFVIIALCSCSSDPREEFVDKQEIGTVGQVFGRMSYEIKLYADGSFYMPTDVLEFTFGTYKLRGNKMFFNTKGGQVLLDTEYELDGNQLLSIHKTPQEILYLEWRK